MATRSEIVRQMQAWIGLNESDGSFKKIIDLYNSYLPHPRGYVLKYSDEWCAGTISAAAIACKCTDIIPPECSCNRMIDSFKKLGVWVENENYTPAPGDIIYYDWQDNSGSADNKNGADHVGMVEKVTSGVITVIEGNYNEAVRRREIKVNGKYIRGFAVPKYEAEKQTEKKSITEVAKDVIAGKYKTGEKRKKLLAAAGYNYSEVQAEVNRLLSKKKTTVEIAIEVINGKWGTGETRKKKLEKAGYNYNDVQAMVNQLMR